MNHKDTKAQRRANARKAMGRQAARVPTVATRPQAALRLLCAFVVEIPVRPGRRGEAGGGFR